MKRCVVCLSGGLDSAVLLAKSVHERIECTAVGFTYGSKHNQYENQAAKELADHYAVNFQLFDLSHVIGGTFRSALLKGQGNVPEGHYEAESMRQTVVPGRNLIFLAIAAGLAESIGASEVRIGVHRGDHYIYPDCRPGFTAYAGDTILLSSDGKVRLETPFLHYNKTEIVKTGIDLRVPFAKTRTCYKDQLMACGKCGSCQERLESFAQNGWVDPLAYENRLLQPKEVKV